MKNQIPTLFLFLSLSTLDLCAQNKDSIADRDNKIHPFFFFQSAYHFGDYSSVNSILSDSNLTTFKENDFSFGAGFGCSINKFIFQYDFYRMHQCVENDADVCSHINYNSDGILFGYEFLQNKSKAVSMHSLFPLVGLSRNRTEFLISDNDMPSMSFSNYLTGTKNVTQVTHYNYVMTLLLGYNFQHSVSKKNNLNLLLGIRAGYSFNLINGAWYEHEDEVMLTNGPKVNPAGINLRIAGGFSF